MCPDWMKIPEKYDRPAFEKIKIANF